MANCRSCGAEVIWAVKQTDGKPTPVDAEPVENGNIELRERDEAGEAVAVYLTKAQKALPAHRPRYVSHFSTCPDAKSWRR